MSSSTLIASSSTQRHKLDVMEFAAERADDLRAVLQLLAPLRRLAAPAHLRGARRCSTARHPFRHEGRRVGAELGGEVAESGKFMTALSVSSPKPPRH